jgi:hypothetical protein
MTVREPSGVLARAAALAVALPLVGGALLLAAPPAGAAVNQPVDGAVFTSYRVVDIAADYGRSSGGTERLHLTSPGGPEVEVAAKPGGVSGGTLDHRIDLGCWNSCGLVPNGTWTIRQTGSTNASSTFVTSIAPAAPTGLQASALNPREVRLSWRLGPEPDLTSWDVYEGSAKVKGGVPRSACSAGTCSTVVSYAAEDSGEHTYALRARRSTAPGSASTLESPLSEPVSARLDSSPTPAPTTAPSTGGAESGSPGGAGDADGSGNGRPGRDRARSEGSGTPTAGASGSASAGSPSAGSPTPTGGSPSAGSSASAGDSGSPTAAARADQRNSFATSFNTFGPKLGIPKMPPLPQTETAAPAPELADGTYEPSLGFEDQVVREPVETAASSPALRARGAVGSALDSERLVSSSAGALVLLLAGAHLRRWLLASSAADD